MTQLTRRRHLFCGLFVAVAMLTFACSSTPNDGEASEGSASQEFYELRIYRTANAAKQDAVQGFVETALQPALNRQGIDRIGVFRSVDAADTSIYLVIPYSSLDKLAHQNDRLEADAAYHTAASGHFGQSKADAAFTRIDSRLMRAFAGMPTLVKPSATSASRILELRIYESHNEHLAKLKVEMFNKGEIDIMRDVEMAPVFYGETLISNDVPNLTYMLSADSPEAHKKHWAAFIAHPEWDRMKNMDRYKGTVSKITSITLKPTAASQF